MFYVCILLFFVFFAGIAMTIGEGLWSNTVNLLCLLISIPTGYIVGVPFGIWGFEQADTSDGNFWYFIFAGYWLSFFVSMLVLRVLCDKASRVRMRFIPQFEMVAGPLMGLFVAVLFTSWLTFTIVYGPRQAGVWDTSKMADWEKSTIQYFNAPAYNLVLAFEDDVKKFK
ncbi:hypothetical protein [Adhaeretor mobilis]|uniref:Uncharacterized protein n=1 Tax=Adhaeretor mobilis TaxID=1930276 RepID=A0A517N1H9_9BACT|nr:hypothetical protein [Adhaeretor mobilis]QDT00992.1 hypothetical protein HG15A2_43340 [Adhaeretor mobilis]